MEISITTSGHALPLLACLKLDHESETPKEFPTVWLEVDAETYHSGLPFGDWKSASILDTGWMQE